MTRRLVYFNYNGLAESTRYMFHYGRLDFEDYRYNYKYWPTDKQTMPYWQIPVYKEVGRTLNQSIAIARYIASQVGLLPSDPWEQAKLDAAVLTIYDYVEKLFDYYWEQDPVKKESEKQTFDEATSFFLSRFENELNANNGHFGEKLSWADFVLVSIIESYNLFLTATIHEDYPTITALMSEIHALPGVKDYVAKRKPYVKPGTE